MRSSGRCANSCRSAAAVLALLTAPAVVSAVSAAPVLTEQAGHSLSVDAVAVDADGGLALTGGRDGRAILWDASSGGVLRAFPADRLGVVAVDLSADGRRALTAGAGVAVLWDAETGRELRRFGRPGEFVAAASFWPDARRVLVAGPDGSARVYDAATGKLSRAYQTAFGKLAAAAGSRDGRRLALSDGSAAVLLVDAKTGATTMLSADEPVARLAFSPDGSRLAASGEKAVRAWTTADGRLAASFEAPAARGLAFSRDGRAILTCGGSAAARAWELDGAPLRSYIGHLDAVRALALSADGATLITGSDDHSARLWDAASGAEKARLSGVPVPILQALVSADGRRLVTIDAQAARLWSLEDGTALQITTGDFSGSSSFSLSDDGRLLASVRQDKAADLKNLVSGQDFGTFQWSLLRADLVALDPAGRYLATAHEDRIQLWDTAALVEKPGAPPAKAAVNGLWTALGGRRLLYLDVYGALRLWDVDGARERAQWLPRAASPPDAVVAPGGAWAATAEPADGRSVVSVRSLGDAKLAAGWEAERDAVPYALSRDGKTLLMRRGAELSRFDASAGRPLGAWSAPAGVELSWPAGVEPGLRWLAAARGGDVVFLSVADGKELARLSQSEKGWVARAPDGRYDASAGALRWTSGLRGQPLSARADPLRMPGLLARVLSAAKTGRP